jgi:hypothetical protein
MGIASLVTSRTCSLCLAGQNTPFYSSLPPEGEDERRGSRDQNGRPSVETRSFSLRFREAPEEEANKFQQALEKGQPYREKIALTALGDKVRQLI